MGVLEGTYVYSKKELISELIYQEVCRRFGIKTNEIIYEGIDDEGYIVKYIKHDGESIKLREFLKEKLYEEDKDDEDLFDSESKKEQKESLRRERYNSLESLENGLSYLYPRSISYNSERRILRNLTNIVTVDYLLGNTSRDISNVTIYKESDKEYKVEEVGKNNCLFGKNPGITPFTCPSKDDTFKRTLEKTLDKYGRNFSISLFVDSLIKYSNELDINLFADIITSVMMKYYLYLPDSDLDSLMDNYKRQRVLIQDTYNFKK